MSEHCIILSKSAWKQKMLNERWNKIYLVSERSVIARRGRIYAFQPIRNYKLIVADINEVVSATVHLCNGNRPEKSGTNFVTITFHPLRSFGICNPESLTRVYPVG